MLSKITFLFYSASSSFSQVMYELKNKTNDKISTLGYFGDEFNWIIHVNPLIFETYYSKQLSKLQIISFKEVFNAEQLFLKESLMVIHGEIRALKMLLYV